ncbi:MAG TPA: glycosyltransferase, partial [Terriglobales bacterium]
MAKPIFYDPQRKRWKRLRRVLDVTGIVITLVIAVFLYSSLLGETLPGLLLPTPKHTYHPIPVRERDRQHPVRRGSHRHTSKPASQVVLNQEPIRAAFYVTWDAGSYASLREYLHQIDLLFPEWLHVLNANGRLQGVDAANTIFDVIDPNGKPRPVDAKVMPLIRAEKAETEVFPLINNFDPVAQKWLSTVGDFLQNAPGRQNFRNQVLAFLASDSNYHGISLDLEEIPTSAQPGFNALVAELGADLHARGMKLYVNVPVSDNDYDYKGLTRNSDGLILMDYDEHQTESASGPIASQEWFTTNLREALRLIPREKIICAIGNYGYEWTTRTRGAKAGPPNVHTLSVQEAWLKAQESESPVEFDPDSMNPRIGFTEDDGTTHRIWFLDAVTALNQMRAARDLGIRTFALWRLGAEDRSLWEIWDHPLLAGPQNLENVPPGQDVAIDGEGEVLRITQRPSYGARTVSYDPKSNLISGESFAKLPTPYELMAYGTKKNQVAITFDDGPDPAYTPKILDILKQKNAKATFFLIGLPAQNNAGLMKRIYDEGHEIGNHTLTHPDISEISRLRMETELNVTERLFASKLGVKPLFFRAPYSIDQEPDTADEVRPLEEVQDMGYITIGDKIDPNDWETVPRRTGQQIADDVFSQLGHGNIILLHDGGGNRSETVKALPLIIDGVRSRGYEIVAVSDLLGKTRAEVMPPLGSDSERLEARIDSLAFWIFATIRYGVVLIFFLGDILMSARLLFVGALAIADRIRGALRPAQAPGFEPPIAVLVPAYNEEKVIARTITSVLNSTYKNLRIIVIDDGSKDRTYEIARTTFAREIEKGKVLVLTKPNAGKAEALNFALKHVTEEFYVGIDADTVIAKDAIRLLIPNFSHENVGAVAGNAKVGNRINLWTRWQALEYITSQNFERRALDIFGVVTVVPGAIGAWRTRAVHAAEGYHPNTVAEDADLTMNLLEQGYKVVYEDRALAFTEAPMDARGLMKQRFRWSFGILQAVWKHRRAFGRRGALGWVALPNILIFQILLPLVSPFIDIMFAVSAISYMVDRHFHPAAANPASFHKLVLYFLSFLVIDFVASSVAFALERRDKGNREDYWLLAHIWLQRFAYRQVFSVVLFKTIKRAIDGRAFSWDKLERTAALSEGG